MSLYNLFSVLHKYIFGIFVLYSHQYCAVEHHQTQIYTQQEI